MSANSPPPVATATVPQDPSGSQPAGELSRATALGLLAVIVLVTLGLGLTGVRAGLPAVFHSDYIQAQQAVELLRDGVVKHRTIYPITLVFAYAAADLAAFAAGHTVGWKGYESWDAFLEHLARREVHHAIDRALNAVLAALLAVAVYRLARLRFDRRVALLAAAIAAFCPLQTIYVHQVRPHIPVITLAALVGPMLLRSIGQPTLRAGLRAGAAAGLVNLVFQVGMSLAGAAVALIVLFTRPLRALPRVLLGAGLGFAAAWLGLRALIHHSGLVTDAVADNPTLGDAPDLGYGLGNRFADLGRIPQLGFEWVLAEPLRAVAVAGFLLLCILGRRRWRDAVLYGTFPVVSIVAIGFVMGARPRYTMYATPFLAPLAASACLAIPGVVARRLAAALLVLAPLLSSVRCDLLLLRTDTRLLLTDAVPDLTGAGLKVLVQDDLVPSGRSLPPRADRFPPRGDFRKWLLKEETPQQTFAALAPDVFAQTPGDEGGIGLRDSQLTWRGYSRIVRIGAGRAFLPDEPDLLLQPELWSAERPGPTIDVWARTPIADRARAALPEALRAE